MFVCVLMYDYISTIKVINVRVCFDVWLYFYINSYRMFVCVLMYDYISSLIVI